MPVGHPSKDFTELQFSPHLLNSLKLPVFVLLVLPVYLKGNNPLYVKNMGKDINSKGNVFLHI